VDMLGPIPGQFFTYTLATLNSSLISIEIINPATNTVERTWYPPAAGAQACSIFLNYDPPVIAMPLHVRAEFPQALSSVPTLMAEFSDRRQQYYFTQGPGLRVYELDIPAGDMTSYLRGLNVLGSANNLLCERFFGLGSGGGLNVQNLWISPDPPLIGQALLIHAEFSQAVAFIPRWRVNTVNGLIEGSFDQAAGGTVYETTVPASQMTAFPIEVFVLDGQGNYLPGGELFFVADENFTCNAIFEPFPPVPFSSLTVIADYDYQNLPSYIPTVFVEFSDGHTWSQAYTQAAGMAHYQMNIPGSIMTDYVDRIAIGSAGSGVIDCGAEFVGGGDGLSVDLDFTPDPPTPAVPFYVTATFTQAVPFVPRLFIEFESQPRKNYIFPGAAGLASYQITVPAGDMTGPVTRVGVEDPDGNLIPYDEAFGSGGGFFIDDFFALGGNKIDLCWTYDDWIHEYHILYGTSPGSYNGSDSPVVVQNISCYILGDYEVLIPDTVYYIKVEAYDINGNLVFASPEEMVTLSSSTVEYPTNLLTQTTGVSGEIRILWDSVSGAAGYKVLYGTGSRTYNESGSPLDIPDPNATQAIISGLFNNTLYYITVEAYNSNNVESNNPNEVSAYPGTGGGGGTLTVSPSSLSVSASAGDSISQQTISVTNSGTAAFDIRAEAGSLTKNGGGGSIPSSQYTLTPASASISPSGSANFNIGLSVPSAQPSGVYEGTVRYYSDTDNDFVYDAGELFVLLNVSLTVASVDHIRIESNTTSSAMGSPIFVTLTAENSSNETVSSYDTDVTVAVSEVTSGQIPGSWHLSINDGPRGPNSNQVSMYGGQGAFTVDALEPETLQVSVNGISSVGGPLSLKFTPAGTGSTAVEYAIIGPNRAPTGTEGTKVWIAAVDSSGKVVTNYTGNLDLTLNGSALFVSNGLNTLSHTYAAAENGQHQVTVKDTTAETVTLTAKDNPVTFSDATLDIEFTGVTKYLVYDGASAGTSFTTQGSTINFTLRAADASNNTVRSYNKTATFTRTSDPTNNAYLTDGNSITFQDGLAEITLNNSPSGETVEFIIDENSNPAIDSGTISVNFQSSDSSAPEIVRVEMDTPWIVHIYFNEDVTSATAGVEDNYNVGGGFGATIDKVCWYGDNVTLNLSAIPGSGLGTSFNLTVNGVQDSSGNTMSNVTFNNIAISGVDFQGGAGPTNDWFEVQASDTSPSGGETVHITVYHKNVCGYLTGSNNTNKNATVGSVTISYGGSGGIGALSGSPATSVDVSSGRADFDITIAAGHAGQTVIVTASDGTVSTTTTNTVTIE